MVDRTAATAALLLLADGRLPAGGYAHSGGLEATVAALDVTDADGLAAFLEGRAATAGYVAACFAAAGCAAAARADLPRVRVLDAELDARMPSPATRDVSRALGRQLLRAAAGIRPHPLLGQVPGRLHQGLAYGVVAAVFDLAPGQAAGLMLHESVAGPAAAAVKVLSTDPFTVHRALASLTGLLDELADAAADLAEQDPADLPAMSSPLLDIAAERHHRSEARLFAS